MDAAWSPRQAGWSSGRNVVVDTLSGRRYLRRRADRVADVFISYSRRDSQFVQRLATGLGERGKSVWIDVEGIRDGEVFPEALRRAIEASDAFLFVISPDAVRSAFCVEEVEHAASLNKRIVPLSLRPVQDEALPEEVRFRNWIPAGGDGELPNTLDRLLAALDTDLDWERQHTRLTVKALEWAQSGRDKSFVLRGADLDAAERWLAAGVDKDPGPTALEAEYLAAARAAAARRQRNAVAGSLGVTVLSVGLLVFALISLVAANHARDVARAQALTADAERVGAEALTQKDVSRAMLYAVAAVKLQGRVETRGDLLGVLQQNAAAIRSFRASDGQIDAIAVARDLRLVATGDSAGEVRFERMSDWTQAGSAVSLTGPVGAGAMAFSPSGHTLAVVTTQTGGWKLYTIDVASGRAKLLGTWSGLPAVGGPVDPASLAYDASGRHIALVLSTFSPQTLAATPLRLLFLNAATGRAIWQQRYPATAAAQDAHAVFARDGSLLTSTSQGDTLRWDVHSGRVTRSYPIGGEPAVSADGKHLALVLNSPSLAIPSARVAVLDLSTGRFRILMAGIPSSWLSTLAYTADDQSIVGGDFNGNIFVWNATTGGIVETLAGPAGEGAGGGVLDPTGRTIFSGAQDGTVLVSDLSGTRRLGRTFIWNTPSNGCAFTPCQVVNRQSTLMATDQADGSVALIDLRSLRKVATLPAHDGAPANALAYFPDGRRLLVGGENGHLTVWDVFSRRVVESIDVGKPVWWDAVSPDGRLIAVQTQTTGSSISDVQVRTASGKLLWSHQLEDAELDNGSGSLYFSPDGREVAALGCCTPQSTVASWSSRSGTQIFDRRVIDHATALVYSPDGRLLLVTTENGQVLLWGARNGLAQAPPLRVAGAQVFSISFPAHGTVFAVGSFDLSSTLWDYRSRKEIGGSFPQSPAAIPAVAFEPNGTLLIDYLADGAQWPIDLKTWERFACQVAGRDLTRAEWQSILPDRPYQHVCPSSGAVQ